MPPASNLTGCDEEVPLLGVTREFDFGQFIELFDSTEDPNNPDIPSIARIVIQPSATLETWLVCIHLLFRGEEFLHAIAGDDIHWKRKLAKELELGEYHDEWKGKLTKLNYKELAESVKPLLKQAGEAGEADGMQGYNYVYRVQSLFVAHSGLAALGLFMHYGEETWSVVADPKPPFTVPALTPALHTAHLARYVFNAFGLPDKDVERIGDELLELSEKESGRQVNRPLN